MNGKWEMSPGVGAFHGGQEVAKGMVRAAQITARATLIAADVQAFPQAYVDAAKMHRQNYEAVARCLAEQQAEELRHAPVGVWVTCHQYMVPYRPPSIEELYAMRHGGLP